jgi:hypothetical protein
MDIIRHVINMHFETFVNSNIYTCAYIVRVNYAFTSAAPSEEPNGQETRNMGRNSRIGICPARNAGWNCRTDLWDILERPGGGQ